MIVPRALGRPDIMSEVWIHFGGTHKVRHPVLVELIPLLGVRDEVLCVLHGLPIPSKRSCFEMRSQPHLLVELKSVRGIRDLRSTLVRRLRGGVDFTWHDYCN